jgi:molybdenum cofactor guanylyltransferase
VTAGAIVLCGGKSSRMGTPKALLPFGPETMLQRVLRLLGGVVAPIVVVAAANQELPPLPPGVLVTRDEREGRGPLQGLSAGLKALPQHVEAAYVTSCDVPLLVPGFVTQMLDLARNHDVALMEIDGFAHPLSAVYRRVAPAEMTADPDLLTLRNLNTPEEYRQALELAGIPV